MTDLWAALARRCAEPLDPPCTCPDLDVTGHAALAAGVREYVKGWYERCPVHGYEGTNPTYRKVTAGGEPS